MKSTNSASKEYFKFVLITAPLFAVVLLLVDIGWASRSLDQIKSQHNRDIANNMQLARRIIAPLIEDNSSSDTLLNEISSILVNFSRVPGVGCVELKGPELQIIHPAQAFCDVIPKVHLNLSRSTAPMNSYFTLTTNTPVSGKMKSEIEQFYSLS